MPDTSGCTQIGGVKPGAVWREPIGQVFVAHRKSIDRWFRILAGFCLIAYCSVGAIMLPFGSAKLIPDQQENTYPESSILYEAILSAKTGHLYFPLLEKPYLSQPYGPLFYATNWIIAESAKLNLNAVMVRSRTLIFITFLFCGVMVLLISRKLGAPISHAAMSGALMLGFPAFIYWNVSLRPDIPCLLAMLLCIYFSLADTRGTNGRTIASGSFAAASYLIKQTGVAAALAVLAGLLWKRRYREAGIFIASSAIPVIATITLLKWRHEPFVEQWNSVANGALWSISEGAKWSWKELTPVTVLVPICVGLAGTLLAMRKDAPSRTIALFFFFTWLIFAATIWQRGGGHNYILPGLTACALLLPLAIEFLRATLHGWALVPLAGLLMSTAWATSQRELRLFKGTLAPQQITHSALAPFRILSDNPYYTLQGRDPEMLDPFLFHSLELAGHWSSRPVAAELRRGDIDLVILACTWRTTLCSYRGISYFSPEILQNISDNYYVLCSTLNAWVLEPRDEQVNLPPSSFDAILGAPCGTGMRGKQLRLSIAEGVR